MSSVSPTRLLPLAISILACGSSGSPSPTGLAAPSLQTPGDNRLIRQNDPATGCAFSPTMARLAGSIHLDASSRGGGCWGLLLIHDGAQYPALDTQVDGPSSFMRLLQCLCHRCKPFRLALDSNGGHRGWGGWYLGGAT